MDSQPAWKVNVTSVTHSAGKEMGSQEESHRVRMTDRQTDSRHIPRGLVGPGKGMWTVLSSEEGLQRRKPERLQSAPFWISRCGEKEQECQEDSHSEGGCGKSGERGGVHREKEKGVGWRHGGHQPC